MQDSKQTNTQIYGPNVFLEFQIVKDSDPLLLSKELDILIARGKKIHVWSKTVSEKEMKHFCTSIILPTSKEEDHLHKTIFVLRHKEKKTYKEIADRLGIPVERVGYFTKADPLRKWKLDDWIISYQVKESTVYDKVDYLVDNDEKFVERFKRAGRQATFIRKIK
jgi:hypothetical protein